jgi:hypothetical protein
LRFLSVHVSALPRAAWSGHCFMFRRLLEREVGSRKPVVFDKPRPARFALPLSSLFAENQRLRQGVLLGWSFHGDLLFCRSAQGVMMLDLLFVPANLVATVRLTLTLGLMEELSEVSVEVWETEDTLVCACFTAALLHLTLYRRGWRDSLTQTLSVTQRPSVDVCGDRVAVCCGADVFVWHLQDDAAAEREEGVARWMAHGEIVELATVAGGARLAQSVSVEEIAGRLRARLGLRAGSAAVARVEDFEASLLPGAAAPGPLEVCCTVRLRLPAPALVFLRALCSTDGSVRLVEARHVHEPPQGRELAALHAALVRAARPNNARSATVRTGLYSARFARSVSELSHAIYPHSIIS